MEPVQGNPRLRRAPHAGGPGSAGTQANGSSVPSSSQFHHFAVPSSPSASYSKETGLRTSLEPLASQLSVLEKRLGRLEQPPYENAASSSGYNRYTASRTANSPLPSDTQGRGAIYIGTSPLSDHRGQPSSSPSSYLDSGRNRHSMLSALGQSEDLILKLIEENHRLRRRLDIALSEIHRVRSHCSSLTNASAPSIFYWPCSENHDKRKEGSAVGDAFDCKRC